MLCTHISSRPKHTINSALIIIIVIIIIIIIAIIIIMIINCDEDDNIGNTVYMVGQGV